MQRGRLITVEGLDGAGKTTAVGGLAAALRQRGRDVAVLREPGGVELSERIRALVKDPALEVHPRAEALLYAAARAQLVAERLEPLLAEGGWVLLDRFVDSSLAYQGAGRGLGVEAIRELNAFATGGLTPDRTLLLRIDPAAGLARAAGRGGGRRPAGARGARVLRRDRGGVRRARRRRARAVRGDRRRAAAGRRARRLRPRRRAAASALVAPRVRLVPRPGVGDHLLQRAPRLPAEQLARPRRSRRPAPAGRPAGGPPRARESSAP